MLLCVQLQKSLVKKSLNVCFWETLNWNLNCTVFYGLIVQLIWIMNQHKMQVNVKSRKMRISLYFCRSCYSLFYLFIYFWWNFFVKTTSDRCDCLQVNTLTIEMSSEFEDAIQQIRSSEKIKAAVLISNKPGSFIAGADIK